MQEAVLPKYSFPPISATQLAFKPAKRKVALLIGCGEYVSDEFPSLPNAPRDAIVMREILLDSKRCGFANSDVVLLINPHQREIALAIERLFSGRCRDDLTLFFFSGHGFKDDAGRFYLAARDSLGIPYREPLRAISASAVHEEMKRSRSQRQVAILDACFSGAFWDETLAQGPGRVVLTATSATQSAIGQAYLSVYTGFLAQGISTGFSDLDGDGLIDVGEWHEYVRREMETYPDVIPEIHGDEEARRIPIAKAFPAHHAQYRSLVEQTLAGKRAVSLDDREILDAGRIKYGVHTRVAKAIENGFLAGLRFAVTLLLHHTQHRFVHNVANRLAEDLGRERVWFYNMQYLEEIAYLDDEVRLARCHQSEIVVPFFSRHYRKPWCGLKWSAIGEILDERRKEGAVIPVWMDDVEIPGWSPAQVGILKKRRSGRQIAELLLSLYAMPPAWRRNA
uniref:Caspase domain-containing protein n=1 Tax=Candidatus Kentrum sp. LFY TaxID=2126342 RepID=A0A450WDA9_9GAMM|nr:MAG: Caspase domain-containing protein [Candidatus Kentron sp. LFY]